MRLATDVRAQVELREAPRLAAGGDTIGALWDEKDESHGAVRRGTGPWQRVSALPRLRGRAGLAVTPTGRLLVAAPGHFFEADGIRLLASRAPWRRLGGEVAHLAVGADSTVAVGTDGFYAQLCVSLRRPARKFGPVTCTGTVGEQEGDEQHTPILSVEGSELAFTSTGDLALAYRNTETYGGWAAYVSFAPRGRGFFGPALYLGALVSPHLAVDASGRTFVVHTPNVDDPGPPGLRAYVRQANGAIDGPASLAIEPPAYGATVVAGGDRVAALWTNGTVTGLFAYVP